MRRLEALLIAKNTAVDDPDLALKATGSVQGLPKPQVIVLQNIFPSRIL